MRASSLEAHESIKPHKNTHFQIIKQTMQQIGHAATSKEIARQCTQLTRHEAARRLSEMEAKGTIKVVGRVFNEPCRPLLWALNVD